MDIPSTEISSTKKQLCTVTPLSRAMAFLLFITLPIITLYVGYQQGIADTALSNIVLPPVVQDVPDTEPAASSSTSPVAAVDVLDTPLTYNQPYGKYTFINSFSHEGYSRFLFSGVAVLSGHLVGYGTNGISMNVVPAEQDMLPQVFTRKMTTLIFLENEALDMALAEVGSDNLVTIELRNPTFKINEQLYKNGDPVEVSAEHVAVVKEVVE